MWRSRFLRTLFVAAAALAPAASAYAQPQPTAAATAEVQALRAEIDRLRQELDARIAALDQRLAALGAAPNPATATAAPAETAAAPQTAAVPPGAQGAGGPADLPVYGNAASGSKMFNPDIAVIGNFVGAAGNNDVRPTPALALPESEASFQAVVDPYARADFFFSFGEEGVDVEEGFITFPTLPGGLLMKVGKQKAAFGKVNTLHGHVLPWADVPLVTENLLGGEEGINDAGISVAHLIPNRWMFLEATGQVFRGDSGDVFQSQRKQDLSYVAHLRGYHDLSESTNLDLGASYAYGHNGPGVVDGVDLGRFTTELFGIDATVRWKPLQRSIYHSFIGRSEVIWARRGGPDGSQRPSGFFVSGDYQLGRRWYTGLRLDRSERLDAASLTDNGMSWTVTYWPSEFSQVRGQYRRTDYAEDSVANEFLFQFQFAIGAHGAHPF